MKRGAQLLGILVLYLFVSLWRLQSLPSDWFGDISIEHEYVTRILHGEFPWRFALSAGPFYHYAIAPVIAVLGQQYLSYKIASVFFGSLGIIGIYFSGYIIGGISLAGIAACIMSSSFWYIVWVRLGSSPQLATPVILIWSLYFLLRFERYKHQVLDGMLALLIASVGLLVYPASFLFLLVILIGIYVCLYPLQGQVKCKKFVFYGVCVVIFYMLFGLMVSWQINEFTLGYIGEKIPSIHQIFSLGFMRDFIVNYVTTLKMFIVRGDSIFRTNVPLSTHIDGISVFCMVLGLISFVVHKQRRIAVLLSMIVLLLLIPSSLPSNPLSEIPSIGRTLCVVPIVCLLIGEGIWFLYRSIVRFSQFFASAIVVLLLCCIVAVNMYKYFVLYPIFLPNQNQPYGRIVATYINTLPSNTIIRLTDCCWGDRGEPEPKAILYQLDVQKGRESIVDDPFTSTCETDVFHPTLYIFNPSDDLMINQFTHCYPDGRRENHYDLFGNVVFTSIFVKK